MVVNAENWLNAYRAAEQLGSEIMELINERNRLQRSGGSTARVTSSIRVKQSQYSKDVKQLQDGLRRLASSYDITQREVERRQYQLDNLVSKEKQLHQAFQPDSNKHSDDRSGLFSDSGANPDNWSTPYNSSSQGASGFDASTIRSQQQQLLREQDKGLDQLSQVIARQKMMGNAIGDEVDYQNELIDEISGQVDSTTSKLIRESDHIKVVHKKASSCAMVVIIVLLLLAIIVAAVVPK